MMKIDIRDVSVIYPHRLQNRGILALNSIELTFKAETMTAVMGPSGGGKTTLLKVLGGLLKPDTGMVFINDVSFYDLSRQQQRSIISDFISLLPQNINNLILPQLNFYELTEIFLWDKPFSLDEKEILDFANKMKVSELLSRQINSLSTGEKQRIAILLVLSKKPSILLLDEPTAHLNQELIRQVILVISEYTKKFSSFTIITTHDPYVASCLDVTYYLEQGKIVSIRNWIKQQESFEPKITQDGVDTEEISPLIQQDRDYAYETILHVSSKGDLRIPRDLLQKVAIKSTARVVKPVNRLMLELYSFDNKQIYEQSLLSDSFEDRRKGRKKEKEEEPWHS